MIDYSTGRDMAADLGETVLKNPVPLALIGAGIGWFLIANMQSSGSPSRQRRGGQSAANDGGRSQQGGSGGSGSQAYGSVQSAANKTWSAVRSSTSGIGDSVGRRADSVYRSFGDMVEEQPLLLGAAGLIIGAALGATLPGTRYENEMIGETRDDLAKSVQDFGREQYDRAKSVVERTVETVREEAERQGFSVDSAREALDEVKNRATAVAQTAADAARNEAGLGGGSGGSGNQGGGGPQGGGKPGTAGQQGGAQQGAGGGQQGGAASRPAGSGGTQEANRGNDMTSGSAAAAKPTPGGSSIEANRGNDTTSQPGSKGPGAGGGTKT